MNEKSSLKVSSWTLAKGCKTWIVTHWLAHKSLKVYIVLAINLGPKEHRSFVERGGLSQHEPSPNQHVRDVLNRVRSGWVGSIRKRKLIFSPKQKSILKTFCQTLALINPILIFPTSSSQVNHSIYFNFK